MSVSTWVYLPPGVNVEDVARAIGILLGKEKTLDALSNGMNYLAGVKGVRLHDSKAGPQCCIIDIGDIPKEYGNGWWFHYHFELANGQRGLGGGSRAARIALHRRLVELFGGSVDYNDCDETKRNYSKKVPWWVGKEHDRAFEARQKALLSLTPITQDEINKCQKYSAYKD